jgi:hypothetical protein
MRTVNVYVFLLLAVIGATQKLVLHTLQCSLLKAVECKKRNLRVFEYFRVLFTMKIVNNSFQTGKYIYPLEHINVELLTNTII